MESHDISIEMPSLISNADDSSWKYVVCPECDGKFENELDMKYHLERVHEYGETCAMYPCEQCGFQGRDKVELKSHVEESHTKKLYNKRIKQNLKGINFDEDSEDEYVPVDDELLLLEDESCLKKRKRKDTKTATSKKVKTDFDCNMCGKSFSRKDSLTRHRKNYCT